MDLCKGQFDDVNSIFILSDCYRNTNFPYNYKKFRFLLKGLIIVFLEYTQV